MSDDSKVLRDYQSSFDVCVITTTDKFIIYPEDIISVDFIEDIYSFCMHGRISFIDRMGLTEFGGMSGSEVVQIVYGDSKDKKVVTFNIQDSKTSLVNRDTYRVDATLIDTTFKLLEYQTYSLSYKDMKYTDIVKDMADKYLRIKKFDIFDDCKEKIEYFDTSNINPKNNIKWLLERCSGNKTKQPGYLFYQTTQGYNVTTLESLLQQKDKQYLFDKSELYMFDDVSNTYNNRINSYKVKNADNSDIPFLTRGYFLGFNPLTKEFHHQVYGYQDAIERFTILGKYSLLEDMQLLTHYRSDNQPFNTSESDPKIIDNMYFGQWIRKYCLQRLVEVNVNGNENRFAGGMIEVLWRSLNKTDEKFNQMMSGRYIIKSITHHLNYNSNPRYQQSMVLIKNGYEDVQGGTFTKAKKMNLGQDKVT